MAATVSSGPVSQSPAREAFDPIDTSFDPSKHSAKDEVVVESPSLSNTNVLARFEFEPGRSKDGTKILMLEWEDDEQSRAIRDDWEITWEGKHTVLPAKDQQAATSEALNRLYFLLGPGVPIPTQVVLRKGNLTWKTNPLPAIFSPDLGASATQAGKKGVLHTIWAKKRLQVLQREIEQEEEDNAEGVGLQMAYAEKEWIEQNFGIVSKPTGLSLATSDLAGSGGSNTLRTPTSPRSPGGGRLMDKLRGLRLDIKGGNSSTTGEDGSTIEAAGTSSVATDEASSSRRDPPGPSNLHNPLSPETSDVAYGSFGSFAALKGMPGLDSLAAKPPQPPIRQQQNSQLQTQPQPQPQPSPQPRFAAVQPPDSFVSSQSPHQGVGMASLNAFASNVSPSPAVMTGFGSDEEKEDGLFALPMSPRSPEMTKSPFSVLKG